MAFTSYAASLTSMANSLPSAWNAASICSSLEWCVKSKSRSTLTLEIPMRRAISALRMPEASNAMYNSAFAACSAGSRINRYFRPRGLLQSGVLRQIEEPVHVDFGDSHAARHFCFAHARGIERHVQFSLRGVQRGNL